MSEWKEIELDGKIKFKCNYCEDEDATFRVREDSDINISSNIIKYAEFIALILPHLTCNKCNKNLEEFTDIIEKFIAYNGQIIESEITSILK